MTLALAGAISPSAVMAVTLRHCSGLVMAPALIVATMIRVMINRPGISWPIVSMIVTTAWQSGGVEIVFT